MVSRNIPLQREVRHLTVQSIESIGFILVSFTAGDVALFCRKMSVATVINGYREKVFLA